MTDRRSASHRGRPLSSSRPVSHETGDIGVSEVKTLFLRAGWIVNEIHSDYGEDLMVQPTRRGQVEKSRLFAQVKTVGASSACRSVTLRCSDLFLWQFIQEPFLLIVWMEAEGKAYAQWMNRGRDPTEYTEGTYVRVSVGQMLELNRSRLDYLHSELRNISYRSTLEHLSDFIESNGGYNSADPQVAKAKLAATKIGLRMLSQDGILRKNRRGEWFVESGYLIRNLEPIVDYAASRGNSRNRLLRIGTMSWALFVVAHAWDSLYENLVDDYVFWALANVVEVTVTSNEAFLPLVRSIVRRRVEPSH